MNKFSERVENLIKNMSVTEKALLCSGRKFWFTRGIKKYGIEPYMVTDGPHGLRKQGDSADNLGINDSKNATCFPTAVVMASTWNKELIHGLGEKLAEEALEENVGVVLGPGANIKRDPLCGRNFEYYSEDPYLSGKCAASFINGIQSKGIGTSLKHYAVNNQETDRLRIDAVVDERALREIYLNSFETAVREAQPYTVMCAYNKVNGTYASENKFLLTDVLRGDWDFNGYVMTDWGAINNRVEGLKAGLDLEMPGGSGESVYDIINAVEDGTLDIEILNTAVRRLLNINFKIIEAKKENYKYDRDGHHEFARKVAVEGAVLLKNEGSILPLDKKEKILLIGAFAKNPRYQGSGSSLIRPNKLTSLIDAFDSEGIKYDYAEGFSHVSDEVDTVRENAALKAAQDFNGVIVVAAGLTMFYESEGFDRKHMRLPDNQISLINKLAAMGKKTVVLLYGGSPVEMPWLGGVKGLINMYLPGEACGEASTDVLFGKVNPSGKLAETFPVSYEDCASSVCFPEGPETVEYRESIYVGYRYFDKAHKKVMFPFGYGLSYTEFAYSDLKVLSNGVDDGNAVKVSFKVKNTGKVSGKEICQIYVSKNESKIFRPVRELKGFEKISLEPGEEKTVTVELTPRSFTYYNVKIGDFTIEPGEYFIEVGASSRDIKLSSSIIIDAAEEDIPYDAEVNAAYDNFEKTVTDEVFKKLLGRPLPSKEHNTDKAYWDITPRENRNGWFGKLFHSLLIKGASYAFRGKDENSVVNRNFMKEMLVSNTLRAIATTNGGVMGKKSMEGLIIAFNGKFFKGMRIFFKAMKANKKMDKMLKEIEEQS